MKKDLSLLRPFNLEAAKRGERVCYGDGAKTLTYLAGPNKANEVVLEPEDKSYYIAPETKNLRMAPLFWLEGRPVYPGDKVYHLRTDKEVVVVSHTVESTGKQYVIFADGKGGVLSCRYPNEVMTWQAPKTPVKVKFLAVVAGHGQLMWITEEAYGGNQQGVFRRVPSEDKEVEVEGGAA